jgi:hypothetical protein
MASVPAALLPTDQEVALARALAPVLYLQRDEPFQLARVVAVFHPTRPVIAYHLLWEDDAYGSWIPFTVATDQEIVWVGYDSTKAPAQVWTYWHGTLLHTTWPRRQVEIDVQWGKHGSLPRGTLERSLPNGRTLRDFYLTVWALPDFWLGNFTRRGPFCFCHGPKRYREFTRPLPLTDRIDFVVRTDNPREVLGMVFGERYSEKTTWPD